MRRTDAELGLLHALRHHGYRGRIAVSADSPQDAERLEAAGADRVFLPFASGAEQAAQLLTVGDERFGGEGGPRASTG
jgi:hypothetical protein